MAYIIFYDSTASTILKTLICVLIIVGFVLIIYDEKYGGTHKNKETALNIVEEREGHQTATIKNRQQGIYTIEVGNVLYEAKITSKKIEYLHKKGENIQIHAYD